MEGVIRRQYLGGAAVAVGGLLAVACRRTRGALRREASRKDRGAAGPRCPVLLARSSCIRAAVRAWWGRLSASSRKRPGLTWR